jgi:lipoprotein LprG
MDKAHRVKHRLCALFLAAVIFAGGCSTAPPTAMPPEEIVSRAFTRMESLSGFHFVIDRTGAAAFLDFESALVFRRAEGDFVAPDKAQALIRIIGPGLVAEVQIVSIGEHQWETNLLTGKWEELPPNWGFNPAMLFDKDIGIQSIMQADLADLELVGVEELEEVPGHLLYALQGEIDGEKLFQLSYGMMGPKPMGVKLWIAPETFDLHRVQITDTEAEAEEPTIWELDFWEYDQEMDIAPPSLEGDES